MRCASPIRIKNPAKNKRKAAKTPFVDVPCGKCGNCLANKANDWTFRLSIEEKKAVSAFFITLTYEDEYLPFNENGDATLHKPDFQKFVKRLRKAQLKMFPKSKKIIYYAVGEYGENYQRPHYHAIMFNVNYDVALQIDKIWGHGLAHIGEVNKQSINYCTYYVLKRDVRKSKSIGRVPEFSLMSKGIGEGYEQNKDYHLNNKTMVAVVNGNNYRLPSYYRRKWFESEDEEENLRLQIEKQQIVKHNIEEADKRHIIAAKKLERRGYKEPEAEIQKSVYAQARTKQKLMSKQKM